MRTDLHSLAINRLIIHEVPKHLRRDTRTSPVFSDIDSPLDDRLRMFFREKVIETAGSSNAYGVLFDETSGSPIPGLVGDFLGGVAVDFVELSKTIARHLHDQQSGVNPGGLVTIIDCQVGDAKAIGILKLEKEEESALKVLNTKESAHLMCAIFAT